jgi:hypothetical protein
MNLRGRRLWVVATAAMIVGGSAYAAERVLKYPIHDETRAVPAVVTPGEKPGDAPSDAIILFNGKSTDEWVADNGGGPIKWAIEDGAFVSVKGAGYARTKREFGSCQLHVEFAEPTPPSGNSQGRGNSGVFLMGTYELQVLDSYDNKTYADGQCGSVYGQNPPLVNACRKPGEWQTYDIVFHRPIFEKDGKVAKPAFITVLHNGVLVQDHFEIWGGTGHHIVGTYHAHADKMPLKLQDHGNPVKFRNIWVREIADEPKD